MQKGTDQAVTRREHRPSIEAKRVQIVDPFGGVTTDGNFTTLIDAADANTTYVGSAQIGTATSDGDWQIKKISISGLITTISWAGGTDAFTNTWNDRAGYAYS